MAVPLVKALPGTEDFAVAAQLQKTTCVDRGRFVPLVECLATYVAFGFNGVLCFFGPGAAWTLSGDVCFASGLPRVGHNRVGGLPGQQPFAGHKTDELSFRNDRQAANVVVLHECERLFYWELGPCTQDRAGHGFCDGLAGILPSEVRSGDDTGQLTIVNDQEVTNLAPGRKGKCAGCGSDR